jgi:hypothetical protein
MGKLPRDRIPISEVLRVSRTRGEQAGSIDRGRSNDNNCGSGTGGSVGDGTVANSGSFPSVDNTPTAWGVLDGYHNNLMICVNALHAYYGDLLELSMPAFTSLEFGDDLLSTDPETGPISTLASLELEGYLTPVAQAKASRTQVDESIYFNSDHDCCREAYDILGSLCFLDLNDAPSVSRSTPNSTSTTAGTAHRVPLDHILHLNRETSERLGRLLGCSCARYPLLALLYASIISRVMIWYKEAADCTQRASQSPEAVAADTVLCHVSPSDSIIGSLLPWSSTAVSTVNKSGAYTPTLARGPTIAVAPTKMTMGSFEIDDQQVQTALRIQLLLGEMRRTGRLIDLFTSRSSSAVDEFTFSGIDRLYKSLSSWLKEEYSETSDAIRSRLKEIST